jgi:hypothetical protein
MLNNKRYLVELHGCKYLIHNNKWKEVTKEINFSLKEIDFIISDFSAFPNFRQVRSPKNFSDIILEKKLREEGEVTGDNKIIVHHSNEISPQNTDVFYTPVPLNNYTQYPKKTNQIKQIQLLFCFHRLLYLLLEQKAKSENTCAIIFAYHNSIEILVGNRHNIVAFERLEFYSAETSINSDIDVDNIKKTLEFIQRSTNTRIDHLYGYSWLIDINAASWLDALGKKMSIQAFDGHSIKMELNDKLYRSSIAPLFELLTVNESISEKQTKLAYSLYYKMPLLTFFLLILNIGGVFYYFDFKQQSQAISEKLVAFKRDNKQSNFTQVKQINYQPALNLAIELEAAKAKPSYAKILLELMEAMETQNLMIIDELKLNYIDKENPEKNIPVAIELKGNVNKGFANGVIIVNNFVANLRNQGYTLVDSKITPNIIKTNFHIMMDR